MYRGVLTFILTALLTLVGATHDDPDYNPLQNYRPNNVTGLTALYSWVGS